jgi:poly(3-hydroxybutyrate) depolymerase
MDFLALALASFWANHQTITFPAPNAPGGQVVIQFDRNKMKAKDPVKKVVVTDATHTHPTPTHK